MSDVLRILAALDEAGVRYWLGGGWGVEALLGFESREHSDLDLVLDDHDTALPAVTRALATVGYIWGRQTKAPCGCPKYAEIIPHLTISESGKVGLLRPEGLAPRVLSRAAHSRSLTRPRAWHPERQRYQPTVRGTPIH